MKRMMKKIAAVVVSAGLLCAYLPTMAFAAVPTYQVTFSAGGEGALQGGVRSVTYKVPANDTCVAPAVSSTNDIHNATYFTSADLTERGAAAGSVYPGAGVKVDRDITYVMQYTASIDTNLYTVQYVDENGIEIAPSVMGYAAAGTSLTFAAPTIAGHTLADTASKTVAVAAGGVNVLFKYTTDVTTNTVVNTNTQYNESVVYADAPAPAPAPVAPVVVPDEPVPLGPEAENNNENANSAAASDANSGSVSIDDESVPEGAAPTSGMGLGGMVGLGLGGVGLLLLLVVLLKKKKSGNQA